MSHVSSFSLLKAYFSARGYTFDLITLGQTRPNRFVTMKSPDGGYLTFPTAFLSYPFPTTTAAAITKDKIKTYEFAKLLNVTIPATCAVSTTSYDIRMLQEMLDTHHCLIVKPSNGSQSWGLTTSITEVSQLKLALGRVTEYSDIALVQQQVSGEELRFIAINGVIRSVLLRQKPFIIGDGQSTVASLIHTENDLRRRITNTLVTYPQLNENLVSAEILTNERILQDCERFELNTKTMIRDGASVYDVISRVHPSYIDVAQRLTERFGKGFVAVDLMIDDYTETAQPNNYSMIEMNGGISLPMCYSCRDGNHFNIIEDYLGPMFEKAIA